MSISEAFANSATMSTTEISLPRNASYDVGQPQTDDGVYQLFLDLNAMAGGDEFQIRVYEKVRSASTQRIVWQANLVGPQSPPNWVSPSLILMNGWDMTLKKIAGTDRTIEWSIRKVA